MTKQYLSVDTARYALAKLWLIAGGILIVILAAQTIGDVHKNHEAEVFGWALPNFLPTLALILGVLADTAIGGNDREVAKTTVRKDFYQIAWWLSVFYLVLLFATIVLASAKSIWVELNSDKTPFDTLKISSLWLAPCQSLVVMAVGRLYFNKRTGNEGEVVPGE